MQLANKYLLEKERAHDTRVLDPAAHSTDVGVALRGGTGVFKRAHGHDLHDGGAQDIDAAEAPAAVRSRKLLKTAARAQADADMAPGDEQEGVMTRPASRAHTATAAGGVRGSGAPLARSGMAAGPVRVLKARGATVADDSVIAADDTGPDVAQVAVKGVGAASRVLRTRDPNRPGVGVSDGKKLPLRTARGTATRALSCWFRDCMMCATLYSPMSSVCESYVCCVTRVCVTLVCGVCVCVRCVCVTRLCGV